MGDLRFIVDDVMLYENEGELIIPKKCDLGYSDISSDDEENGGPEIKTKICRTQCQRETWICVLLNSLIIMINGFLVVYGLYFMINALVCALIDHIRVETCSGFIALDLIPVYIFLHFYYALMMLSRASYSILLTVYAKAFHFRGFTSHFIMLIRSRRRWTSEFVLWILMVVLILEEWLLIGYGEELWGVGVWMIIDVVSNNTVLSTITMLNLRFEQHRDKAEIDWIPRSVGMAMWSVLIANLAVNLYLMIYDATTIALGLSNPHILEHNLSKEVFLLIRGSTLWYRSLMTGYYWYKFTAPDCTPMVPGLYAVSKLYHGVIN